jgi:hypothetical protein
LHFTRFVSRFDMNDARTTAHRAIFGVRLPLSTTQVDRKLIGLSAERTLDRR